MKKTLIVLFTLMLSAGLWAGAQKDTAADSGKAGSKDPITFTIWCDMPWFWYDNYDGKDVAEKMVELTGVRLKMTRAVDTTQLPIMIASGDLPDFVYTDYQSSIVGLSDPNVCWPMDELSKKYNVDIHVSDIDIANNTADDGHYYTIKNIFIPQERYSSGEVIAGPGVSSAASYRLDIYEAIGSPPLETLDDLEKALLAAKAKYPNIIPFLNDGGVLGYMQRFFMRQMGIPFSMFQYDKNGNVIYIVSNPDLLKYYQLMNRYYRQGLISLEAQTYNYERFQDVRNSGNTFMTNRSSGEAGLSDAAMIKAGSNLRFKLLDHNLKNSEGKAPVIFDTSIGWAGLFIPKNNKDPRRAIEYFAWHRLPESRKLTAWGIEGRHWEYNSEGKTVTTGWVRDAVAAGGSKYDYGIGTWLFGDQGDENAWMDHGPMTQATIDSNKLRAECGLAMQVHPELYFAEPKDGDMRIIYTKLNDMYTTASNEIIFANSEAAMMTAYNKMLQQAKDLGLASLEKWSNDTVKARQARK
jgi:putative aldouronate transport system substrate-binding protein